MLTYGSMFANVAVYRESSAFYAVLVAFFSFSVCVRVCVRVFWVFVCACLCVCVCVCVRVRVFAQVFWTVKPLSCKLIPLT